MAAATSSELSAATIIDPVSHLNLLTAQTLAASPTSSRVAERTPLRRHLSGLQVGVTSGITGSADTSWES
ncbi:MAG: hypothetical protein WBZ04_00380 [Candidatus Nanopelagicales bacterium]